MKATDRPLETVTQLYERGSMMMNELASRYEKPIAAWYFAALLTLVGCEDATSPKQSPAATGAITPPDTQAVSRPSTTSSPRRCLTDESLVPCPELTGRHDKTWKVVAVVWDGKPAEPPFESITFLDDGTWEDSSGVSGAWRWNPRNRTLAFELRDFEALIGAEVLQLSADELVIEFASYAPGMVLTLAPSACREANPTQ